MPSTSMQSGNKADTIIILQYALLLISQFPVHFIHKH